MTRLFAVCAALVAAEAALACSLCGADFKSKPTLRQEAARPGTRLILHGTVTAARLKDGLSGETDFEIKTVLRANEAIKGKKQLVLPRWLPVEGKEKPQYLFFCGVDRGKVDPYRGVPVRGPNTVEYLKKSMALDPKKVSDNLVFYFNYLDDPDPEVSLDAFMEFARASDEEVAKAAPKFDAGKLRKWLKATSREQEPRIGLYAMLLGACGKAEDAALLRSLVERPELRYRNASDGLLAGYIMREPGRGWALLRDILADGRKPLSLRLKVLGTLRFFHGARAEKAGPQIEKALRAALLQGDLADLAIGDLRTFRLWGLTKEVLRCWGAKGLDGPLMQRAVLRYALTCKPTPESKAFLAARRKDSAELVKEVEETLRLEME